MRASFFAVLALAAVAAAAPADVTASKESHVEIAGRCPWQSSCLYQCYRACGNKPNCSSHCDLQCQCNI
ncbi:hypothetical protein BC828DRAFT_403605 [Blastocladiella britannica]|nr:hypothetical protein BC828DRAFT_403605 [Blastocladiella britannica]